MASPGEELLISADSHVIEDPHFWEHRLPAAFKDQAPVFPDREVGGPFQAHPGGWDPICIKPSCLTRNHGFRPRERPPYNTRIPQSTGDSFGAFFFVYTATWGGLA